MMYLRLKLFLIGLTNLFSTERSKKNRLGNYFEYGIEIKGISESNIKCLYHYLKWLGSEYR